MRALDSDQRILNNCVHVYVRILTNGVHVYVLAKLKWLSRDMQNIQISIKYLKSVERK